MSSRKHVRVYGLLSNRKQHQNYQEKYGCSNLSAKNRLVAPLRHFSKWGISVLQQLEKHVLVKKDLQKSL